MAITPAQMEGLWGDGGPYSHVHITRELRILDDRVSRTFFYVKANVNPTTYATLRAMGAQIHDPEILAFLQQATFVSEEEGYEWAVYAKEAATAGGANRVADRIRDAIIRMHHLVMEALEVAPRQPPQRPPETPDEPTTHPHEGEPSG